jgi:signal transduction histidine kinase
LLGRRVDDIVVAEPGWTPEQYARLLTEGRWQGELKFQRKDGSTVPVEVRATVVDLPGGPVYLAAARDITERVTAFALLEQRLGTLSAVARSLAVSQSLETTLNALTAEVVRVTPAVACSVTLIDEEHDHVQTIATCGLPDGYAEAIKAVYQAGANLASVEAHRTRRPVLRSIRQDIVPDPLHAPVHRLLKGIPGDTILSVPVVYRHRGLGTLTGFYPMGHEPDPEEIAFFLTIADQVAVAVENARLFTEAQGKTALEERQRLARELHDSVSQAIYSVTLYTKAASRLLADGESATVATYLDEVSNIAREALQEMRLLIFELRPPVLDQEGLVAALRARLEAVEGRAGLETTLEVEGIGRLPADIEHVLYRIGQEALTNALKHAQARSVSVALRRMRGMVTLTIADDGAGFDPTATGGHGGLGLLGMMERAAQVGGQLRVESTPGAGTRVQVEIAG